MPGCRVRIDHELELREIGRIVRACHERWDGTGYPDGIASEQIPIIARIRLLLRRVQRDDERPLIPEGAAAPQAIAELRQNSGTQFDPAVVEALISTIQRQPLAA